MRIPLVEDVPVTEVISEIIQTEEVESEEGRRRFNKKNNVCKNYGFITKDVVNEGNGPKIEKIENTVFDCSQLQPEK